MSTAANFGGATVVNSPHGSSDNIKDGNLGQGVKDGLQAQQSHADHAPERQALFQEPNTIPLPDSGYHSLGVAFENLTVQGLDASKHTVETTDVALLKMWDFPGFIKQVLNIKTGKTRPLIREFYGFCNPGESLLVLGRPGAGCSTLPIANERAPFVRIEGDIQWANITSNEQHKFYTGDIVFNNEEDVHLPILTVGQTLDTGHSKVYNADMVDRLLNAFGMPHVKDTFVGDNNVRGVSGGERKRVSLSEMLSTNAAVICWDNCVRGLDSSVALHFLRILKELGKSTGMTNVVSIYQASQEMYDLCFDRVIVLYEGEMVYSGPAREAQQYFIDQGWEKKARQTTGDFLTACTSVKERRMRKGFTNVPQTPAEMSAYFRASPQFATLKADIEAYKAFHATATNGDEFRHAVAQSKHKMAGKATPYKANFFQQVHALALRQIRLTKADRTTFIIRVMSNCLNSVAVGAIFYKPADNAAGSFSTNGAIFFVVLYFVIFAFGEVPATVNSRVIQIKHRKLGFYNPAANIIGKQDAETAPLTGSAQALVDVPVYAFQTLMYIIYAIFIVIGSSLLVNDTGSSSGDVFIRGAKTKSTNIEKDSIELTESRNQATGAPERQASNHQNAVGEAKAAAIAARTFTFEDISYTVQVPGGDKKLLNGCTGAVAPGQLTALMGASGAGKTTLLDVISQRKTTGTIEGRIAIGGKPVDSTFSRRTGFCMQADLHDAYATVRECLQFSALLRQDASIPRAEKLAYAEYVLDLLELQHIADAIIGNPDIGGLGVEARKRVTIGVELAARPEGLLFLDEPTSGLDSQAAYEIVSFLRKIAAESDLSVLCTIHQPSGDLFEMFDSVVLLAPGGNTVYAGPTGHNASTVLGYFDKLTEEPCPASANPAEHVLSVVAPVGGTTVDWPGYWRESEEAAAVRGRIAEIKKGQEDSVAAEEAAGSTFAAPFAEQVRELLKRHFRAQYRDGSYITTKLVLAVFFGMFVGFYFYKLQPSIVGVQALSLGLLVLAQAGAPIMVDIAFVFQGNFALYVGRERNGIYSWYALVTSLILVEMPSTLAAFILLFFCHLWTMGLDSSAGAAGLGFMCLFVYSFFVTTSGTLLGVVSPNPFSVTFILSTIWNCYNSLSGALVPHNLLPSPFHYFFGWITPLRFFFGAWMSALIAPLPVTCTERDTTFFNIPSGQTCAESEGYLTNPDATSSCGYCQYSFGSDYTEGQGYAAHKRWRDWGLFILFVVSNILVIYGWTYMFRVRPLYKR
ncbi:hypothetical protein P7C73_g1137, partial [Tremellales sp. Uapishka_1]